LFWISSHTTLPHWFQTGSNLTMGGAGASLEAV
jgi:hypothetical protein